VPPDATADQPQALQPPLEGATAAAVTVRGLVKSYGEVKALVGVDLDVAPGTVLGLLGPNGAGKTTIIRILTTLLRPDAGSARVAGLDVVSDAAKLRERIGLAGQYAAVDENLTGLENLTMVGRLYGEPRSIGSKGTAKGEFEQPQFTATNSEGDVWVSDYANDRVEEFSPSGAFIRSCGEKGSGNGQFNGPTSLMINGPLIYVTDSGNDRIESIYQSNAFACGFFKKLWGRRTVRPEGDGLGGRCTAGC
jgi:ABC transporter